MQQAPEFYVWTPRLEDLLDTHDASNALYCASSMNGQPADPALIEEHWINAADVAGAVCRYWRMRVVAVPLKGVLRPEANVIERRVDSAVEVLERVVKSRRFRVERGVVVLPPGAPQQAGTTLLMGYDRYTDCWRPCK